MQNVATEINNNLNIKKMKAMITNARNLKTTISKSILWNEKRRYKKLAY